MMGEQVTSVAWVDGVPVGREEAVSAGKLHLAAVLCGHLWALGSDGQLTPASRTPWPKS